MVCSRCHNPLRRALHGFSGATKAVLGLDKAPAKIVRQHRALCAQCPHAVQYSRGTDEACWCGRL